MLLRERLDQIESDLVRPVHDTHDYSSSGYSAFDDGYNEGVYDALSRVKDVLEAEHLLDERVA